MPTLPSGTVTFLFTDIEGSTPLWEHEPDRMRLALARHDAILRTAITTQGGHAFKKIGDAFQAAFAFPAQALAAALAAQRAFAQQPWETSDPLRVRMGLHVGPAVAEDNEYRTSHTLNRVARIMSCAHGGQILLSLEVAELVRRDVPTDVSLRDMGVHRLKGLTHLEHLFQVVVADLPDSFPPLKTLDAHPTNLPIQATALIGRERDIAAVSDILRHDNVRLLTLTGPGGTGKTRLAQQVAAELLDAFADGVFFVALAPITDPALVASAITQALGVKESGSQALIAQLKTYLQSKQLLLLLDNFEQILPAASLIGELLGAAPGLKVLVTSRSVLHLYGEREYAVAPLALPETPLPPLERLTQYEAVRLFIERAQAVKADFAVTNVNAPAVAEICARLDGLPLAIELAAARSKLFSPQALLARLNQRLKLLIGGAHDLPARQQTIRNTIEWSYNLLTAGEQMLFRRLGVFVGGCTLEAAEAVCNAADDLKIEVLDGVASLIDKSLLKQVEDERGEPRFLMLETIREYALEQLVASGEEPELLRRHTRFFMEQVEAAEEHFNGPGQRAWMIYLEAEHDNLRAALTWAIAAASDMGLRLAGALGTFWHLHNHHREGRDWLLKALAQTKDDDRVQVKRSRAKALNQAGYLAAFLHDVTQAHSLLEQSVALWREVGDQRGLAYALCDWGPAACFQGGVAANFQGTLRQARSHLEESIGLFRQPADKKGLVRALGWHGLIASFQGDFETARASTEEWSELAREVGDVSSIAAAKSVLAYIVFRHGDYAAAQSLMEEGLQLARDVDDIPNVALIGGGLGSLAYLQGNYDLAKRICEEGLQIWRELGIQHQVAWVLELLGYVTLRQHDCKQAAAHFDESLSLWADLHETHDIARCLAGLAQVAEAEGRMERAARLLGATEVLLEASGKNFDDTERIGNGRIPITNQSEYERHVATVRAALREEAFAAAWAAGRALTLKQAIEEAMTLPAEPEVVVSARSATPAPTPPPPDLFGLSEREVEVLRLVAQGLTDAQVAERLVISPRTVQGHLRSIYGKLDVTSRTAATRLAIEHGLL